MIKLAKEGSITYSVYQPVLVIQLIETLGFCSLKGAFKEILLEQLTDKDGTLMEHMKYLIMLAV